MAAPQALTGAGNLEVSPVSNAVATTVTVARPANTANGDLLVAVVGIQSNSAASAPGAPAGWSRLGPAYNVSGDANRRPSGVYVKPITDAGSEPADYSFTSANSASRMMAVVFRVTGANLDAPDAGAGAWWTPSNSTSTSRALPAATTTVDEALVIGYTHWQTNSVAAPLTVSWSDGTEVADHHTLASGTATHSVLGVATREQTTAGATGTMSATISGAIANGAGYLAAIAPTGAAPEPVTTSMLFMAHRGIGSMDNGVTDQPASDEESVAGLATLMAKYPWIHGVEIDARLSTDNVPFLMHDETGARTHPAMGATGVEDHSAATLDGYGVERLSAFLTACEAHPFIKIMVQHYTAASVTPIAHIVNTLLASPVAPRVILMTSDSGFALEEIRDAGWPYAVGAFRSSAANWTTYSAEFAAEAAHVGFLPPGDADYTTNRAHVATLLGAGYQAGASTVNSAAVMLQAHDDGVRYMLSDDPGVYEDTFSGPTGVIGAGALTLDGTGAASAGYALAGAGELQLDGAGSAAVAAGADGTGALLLSATGSAAAGLSVAGAAVLTLSSTGTVSLAADLSGAGNLEMNASGTASTALPGTLAGAGTLTLSSTGTASVSVPAAGAAVLTLTGTGMASAAADLSGVATLELAGTGSVVSTAPGALQGAGALLLGASGAVGSGIGVLGAGALTLTGTGTVGDVLARDDLSVSVVSVARRWSVSAVTR